MKPRVLLVEDDKNLAETIIHYLELSGVICDYGQDGHQGLSLSDHNSYDVIISDVNMPKLDGMSMCRQIRERGFDTPILLLTANTELNDKLSGFDSGADDYLTKPFDMPELLARILSLSKRKSGSAKCLKLTEIGLELDLDKHSVLRDGRQLSLSRSSWSLLEHLARAYPKAVSRRDLEYAVWGDDVPDSNALKVYIHRLRQKLDKPFSKPIIHVVSGFGFELRKYHDH